MKKTEEEIKAYNDYKKYIRSAAFKKVRDKVFERDGYRCVCCGRTADETTLVCHHKCYRHVGEGNEAEISDCVTICLNSHLTLHRAKFNYRWYSFSHPRNKKGMREVEINGAKILVNKEGTEFYRASDYKQLTLHTNYKRRNYVQICYYDKETKEGVNLSAHRIVAKAFPEICGEWFEGCVVHHKDHNPQNNNAENLQILTDEEHKLLHPCDPEKWSDMSSINCHQYDLDGNYIKTYKNSIIAAEDLGICTSAIRNCTNGFSKTAGDFQWIASNEEPLMKIEPIKSSKERRAESIGISVCAINKDGDIVYTFNSIAEATKYFNFKSNSSISNCLNGFSKTSGGYIWKYKKDLENSKHDFE